MLAVIATSIATAVAAGQGADPSQMTGNQFEATFAGDPEMRITALALLAKRIANESQSAPGTICWPAGFTYMQGAQIIDANLTQYPQALHLPVDMLALGALLHAFPCRSQ